MKRSLDGPSRRGFLLKVFPAALWAGVIFATSCTYVTRQQLITHVTPHLPVDHPVQRFDRFWDGYWWLFVKGWHATEYAVLFGFLRFIVISKPRAAGFLVPLAICNLYAASDEFHQTFVPDRGGNVRDVLIDTGGALIAAGACFLLTRSSRDKSAKQPYRR